MTGDLPFTFRIIVTRFSIALIYWRLRAELQSPEFILFAESVSTNGSSGGPKPFEMKWIRIPLSCQETPLYFVAGAFRVAVVLFRVFGFSSSSGASSYRSGISISTTPNGS